MQIVEAYSERVDEMELQVERKVCFLMIDYQYI